ncbi:uncharacterized protein DUF955 [Ruminococcaceae bacterium R-25]|nr:uncharacterized protein DUF955 [Ruminococcaceae bacterium R-25]SUQ11603.1 protein of unknown function [Oscillospiraceae bacterium]
MMNCIADIEFVDIKLPKKVYEKMERVVVKLFIDLGIDTYPIDPINIIKKLGYVLRKYSDLPVYEQLKLRRKELDATSCYDPELKTFVICYDDTKNHGRIRFTLMHELGHILLGHKEESELARKMANYFAAYALAPSPIIYLYDCQDANELATEFFVTEKCATYCFRRYTNWLEFGGRIKNYEEALQKMFERANNVEERGSVS